MSAEPLTKSDFEILKKLGRLNPDIIPRLVATIEQGFAPDEPTPDELVEWAATEVMGWRSDKIQGTPCWTIGGNALIYLQRMWRPDRNWWDLTQVLIAAWDAGMDITWRLVPGSILVGQEGRKNRVESEPLPILRWLHAELTKSNQS